MKEVDASAVLELPHDSRASSAETVNMEVTIDINSCPWT